MRGTVDEFGRALVTLSIRANQVAEATQIQAWIDTAFNGELVMLRPIIKAAQLECWSHRILLGFYRHLSRRSLNSSRR